MSESPLTSRVACIALRCPAMCSRNAKSMLRFQTVAHKLLHACYEQHDYPPSTGIEPDRRRRCADRDNESTSRQAFFLRNRTQTGRCVRGTGAASGPSGKARSIEIERCRRSRSGRRNGGRQSSLSKSCRLIRIVLFHTRPTALFLEPTVKLKR